MFYYLGLFCVGCLVWWKLLMLSGLSAVCVGSWLIEEVPRWQIMWCLITILHSLFSFLFPLNGIEFGASYIYINFFVTLFAPLFILLVDENFLFYFLLVKILYRTVLHCIKASGFFFRSLFFIVHIVRDLSILLNMFVLTVYEVHAVLGCPAGMKWVIVFMFMLLNAMETSFI